MRSGVTGLDRDRSLKLARRLRETAILLVEKPKVVVGLCVPLVAFKERVIALQRTIEIPRALRLERRVEVMSSRS